MEFGRHPRKLEMEKFKATEVAQALMYTSPVIFSRDEVDPAVRNNIIYLFCGLRLLADPVTEKYAENRKLAGNCLQEFVAEAVRLFGRTFNVFSVHNLTHLAEEVYRHGPLYQFSAFPAENYLREMLPKVRAPNQPLMQLVNLLLQDRARRPEDKRREELKQQQQQQQGVRFKHPRGENIPAGEKYHAAAKIGDVEFNADRVGDRFCEVAVKQRNGTLAMVYIGCTKFITITRAGEEGHFVEGVRLNVEDEEFFSEPFDASRIGIRLTTENENGCRRRYPVANIRRKLYLMPLPDTEASVVIPMLNTYKN
jgi:hypothetical protein